MTEKFFHPKKHTGWKKSQTPSVRRRHLMNTTKKNLSLHKRYLEAGRRAQALSNVTKDKATEQKARADARYFFKKLH